MRIKKLVLSITIISVALLSLSILGFMLKYTDQQISIINIGKEFFILTVNK